MPSWIMHGLLQMFGPSVALPFVAAQTCIVLALALTWRLGCEFMSPRRSLIAMALTSLVTYHNIGADSFNHNTVLLPFQAATVLLFYWATRRGDMYLWALTGLFAGLSMLVKYVALMPVAGLLLYFVLDRRLHRRRSMLGLAVAASVFVLVLLPHALWLETTNFLPFRYARSVALPMPGFAAGLAGLAEFSMIQGLRVLPMLLGLAFILSPREAPSINAESGLPARDRLFLTVAALAPLLGTVAYAIAARTELQSRWGVNAFLLSGLAAMALVKRIDTPRMQRRALRFVVGAHVGLSLGMTLGKTAIAEQLHWRTRANFPGALLAKESQAVWRRHTDAPLRIVVSDIWLGGNIIANSSSRIAVLIDGHLFKSPWVSMEAIRNCGALVLDDRTSGSADNGPALDELMAQSSVTGTWNLPWAVSQRQATDMATGVVQWGIIEPHDAGSCSIK